MSAWKPGRVDTAARVGPAHVIDHHLGGEAAEQLVEVRMVLDVEQELHVPAEMLHPLGKLARATSIGRPVLAVRLTRKPRMPGRGEMRELRVGDALADQRDAAQATPGWP